MRLYHGTDIDSALGILNDGLDAGHLTTLQQYRPTQLGHGWYAACDAEVAWFFAALAPGNVGRGYTVIELDISDSLLTQLVVAQQALKSTIANVLFAAEQYWFALETFALLNASVTFRPYLGQERSDD